MIRPSPLAFGAAAAVALGLFTLGSASLSAQTKPKDATGQCKDGTYTKAATKSGACSSHGGVATWYADESGAKKAADATKDGTTTAAKATAGAAKTTGEATADASKATAGATTKGAKTAADATTTGAKTTADATTKGAKTAADATTTGAKSAANATKKGIGAITGGAKKPADAPAAATGKCKDGSYTEAADKQGACSQHGGVDAWYK
jgi:hypothetical protein